MCFSWIGISWQEMPSVSTGMGLETAAEGVQREWISSKGNQQTTTQHMAALAFLQRQRMAAWARICHVLLVLPAAQRHLWCYMHAVQHEGSWDG